MENKKWSGFPKSGQNIVHFFSDFLCLYPLFRNSSELFFNLATYPEFKSEVRIEIGVFVQVFRSVKFLRFYRLFYKNHKSPFFLKLNLNENSNFNSDFRFTEYIDINAIQSFFFIF